MNTLLDALKILLVILKWVVLGAAALALLVGVYLLGFQTGSGAQPTDTRGASDPAAQAEAAPDKTDAVWTCSMHPQIREPKPGDCPICGMKLVPAKGDSGKAKVPPKTEKKYACSMFCVPPLPEPGKCPVCGMEMVEVSDDAPGGSNAAAPRLTVSKNARALAEIRTTPVERRYVTATIRMVGKVAFDETARRTITAWAAGRLDRLFVDYTGVMVRKGDAMVSLYSPDLVSAQEELIQALRAARELDDDGAFDELRRSTQDTIEAVRARLRNLGLAPEQIAAVEKAAKPSDHVVIRAPEGGIVVEKTAIEGMYVKTGTRIYTIADLSTVWVKLDAYESDLAWIRYGQEVAFETEAYPGRTFHGRITFIDPVLNGRTRTVKVRVNVPNPDGALKPDMFVRGRVRSRVAAGGKVMDPALAGKWISPRHPEVVKDGPGKCDKCGIDLVRAEDLGYVAVDPAKTPPPLVIPTSAALVTGRRAVVYVETEPGVFEGREVVLGARAGDHYLVKSGLTEGEKVVVNGAFKIDSAMQIRAKPSMMSPRPEPAADAKASQGTSAKPGEPAAKPQTHCPVMGKPIQKHVFTDYDGMRIYFCCPPCIAKFEADPEPYLKKMRDAGVEPEKAPE